MGFRAEGVGFRLMAPDSSLWSLKRYRQISFVLGTIWLRSPKPPLPMERMFAKFWGNIDGHVHHKMCIYVYTHAHTHVP